MMALLRLSTIHSTATSRWLCVAKYTQILPSATFLVEPVECMSLSISAASAWCPIPTKCWVSCDTHRRLSLPLPMCSNACIVSSDLLLLLLFASSFSVASAVSDLIHAIASTLCFLSAK